MDTRVSFVYSKACANFLISNLTCCINMNYCDIYIFKRNNIKKGVARYPSLVDTFYPNETTRGTQPGKKYPPERVSRSGRHRYIVGNLCGVTISEARGGPITLLKNWHLHCYLKRNDH